MTKAKSALLLFLLIWTVQELYAQENKEGKSSDIPATGWYVGIDGGVPFGFSSFSSFGADKTRVGYDFGLFGGYRFNPVISAELFAKWGQTSLASRGCCADAFYWLGSDGLTYHAPVAGLTGADYADLKSSVFLQQYGAQMNVNLLGFFRQTRQSRLRLELSPVLAAVGTKADAKTIADGRSLIKDNTRWHLGAGGKLQASYAITDNFNLGIYSGITGLTGKGMDGLAERIHSANFLWESGLRLSLSLGGCRRKSTPATESVPVTPIVPARPVEEKPAVVEEQTPATVEEVVTAPVEEETPEVVAPITFPVIYFDFDRTDIRNSEIAKLQDICNILRDNPDMKIRIDGWTDPWGGTAVNRRVSLRRAESVKTWLVGQGIDATRLQTQGMGIDYGENTASKARRAAIIEIKTKEEQL